MPPRLESAEDGHEGGLSLGPLLAAIGVAVLPDQDSRRIPLSPALLSGVTSS